MPRRWYGFRNPWDREYAMRGALWRGVADARFMGAHVPARERVVDLGCGDGKFLAGLAAAGFRTLGLDSAPHALRRAGERRLGPLALADARRLPFLEASLGAASARYLLGALRAAGRSLAAAEVSRALKPGGVLLLEEFSPRDFRFGKGREVEPSTFERNRGILTHYFERHEAPRLFPEFAVLTVAELAYRQRTGPATVSRHAWRWVLRRHSNDSRGASPDGAP